MKTVFLRVLGVEDKAKALLEAIHKPNHERCELRFDVAPECFNVIPGSPFAYWARVTALRCFQRNAAIESEGRHAAAGAQTRDNLRFVRTSWEVSAKTISAPGRTLLLRRGWVPLAKGGSHSRFYADAHLLVQWGYDGRELKAATGAWRAAKGWGDHWRAAINSTEYYGRPGITWPVRSQKGFSARVLGAGAIFGHKGPTVFVAEDQIRNLKTTLAIMNSAAFGYLVSLQMAFGAYEVGVIQHTPVPDLSSLDEENFSDLANRAWQIKRSLDTRTETSHAFVLPVLLQIEGDTFLVRAHAWSKYVGALELELDSIQANIDERCFRLYGIDQVDRHAITEGFGGNIGSFDVAIEDATDIDKEDDVDDEDEDDADDDDSISSAASLAAELISWVVGVVFGRFDVRFAIGERALPTEPEPFDPLPVCSLAMLTGEDGLPLTTVPAGYPLNLPENGTLVDDPGHPQDFTTAVRAVFDVVFGARADVFWQEAAALLDPKDHDLRAWLSSSFFEHHLKRHSKSRRKAPIVWQLGVPSGRYSVWFFAHRLTRDSFFQLQNDIVIPKLVHEERQLTSSIQTAGGSPSASARKEIAAQVAFIEELRGLLEEVKRVAPLWNPMLDDGVVLTMAPLWRLVPQYKPWQKELKGKWEELCAGKYDWSHLAMHLLPERVVPKCATDRSLAIAHGLEEVFWVEDADGKWQQRATPMRPVEEIVRERSFPAVKAALTSLLDAANAISGNGRGRGRRSGIVAAHEGIL